MPALPRLSEESEESFDSSSLSSNSLNNGPSVNFSRPRPSGTQSNATRNSYSNKSSSDRSSHGTVHTLPAFHDSNGDFPAEPRFSLDSERTTRSAETSASSASSDFAWDGEAGELKLRPRRDKYAQQRYVPEPLKIRPSNGGMEKSQNQTTTLPRLQPSQTNTSISSASTSNGIFGITKRISVDQQSERISLSTAGHEDDASHHTVSDDEDSGSFDMEGRWQSSNYDTSGLTEAQIRKLQKKGINPSLYAEMKAAKKGKKKLIGPLLGNSFLG